MSRFNSTASAHFSGSRLSEAIVEAGLTLGAAAFTTAIWLSAGAWALAPGESLQAAQVAQATQAAQPPAVRHVTLPTVIVVGRRDALEGIPVTTTAQNTAAFQVNLR